MVNLDPLDRPHRWYKGCYNREAHRMAVTSLGGGVWLTSGASALSEVRGCHVQLCDRLRVIVLDD